jgi:cytochrome c oxidase cbb3-type subunit III
MNPSGKTNNTGQGDFEFVTRGGDPRIRQLTLTFFRRSTLILVLVGFWTADGIAVGPQGGEGDLAQKYVKSVSTRGKQTFASTCAGCHGLDGRGGERAPNIVENPKIQRLSDTEISHIIENGVPGTGMPAFHSLQGSDVKAVVTYLRSLQGKNKTVKLPGDPDRGERVFFGKAACSGCHMVEGKGGFIASDLSGYARSHAIEKIHSAIISPTPGGDSQTRMVTATTRAGEKYVGRIRNEDNFSVQFETLDGTFYFLDKSDLKGLDLAQTLMPSDYGSTLSSDELNDVISYLMRVAGVSRSTTLPKVEEWEE